MTMLVFDLGKVCFFIGVFVLLVSLSEARYTCTYIDRTYWHFQELKTRQCLYGCCGEGVDKYCCAKPEEQENYRKLWIIVASVSGGIAVLCVIMTIVLCACKAKNTRRSRIYDGSTGQRQINLLYQAPPSQPVNVFVIDADRERQRRVFVPSSDGGRGTSNRPDTRVSDEERPPPVFNSDGLISRPPPYSYVDINPTNGASPTTGTNGASPTNGVRPTNGANPTNDAIPTNEWKYWES